MRAVIPDGGADAGAVSQRHGKWRLPFREAGMLLILLAFCTAHAAGQPRSAERVKVGLIIAASGYAASLGSECRLGFEAARQTFPFAGTDFVYGDSRSEGPAAVSEFKKMSATEHVAAVVTHQSQPTMQINPLSAALRLPLLGVIAQGDFLANNPCAFRFWPSAEAEAEALRPVFRARGIKRLALITVEDEYALSIRERLLRVLREEGGAAVFDERVLKSDADFRAIVPRVKSAAPEAIFVNAAIGQLVPLTRQIRALGLNQQIVGNAWFMTQEVAEMLGAEFLEGVIFARMDPDKRGFREKLKLVDPSALPTPMSYACFAAMAALHQALAASARPAASASLLHALAEIDEVALPDETLPMVDRALRFSMSAKTIRDGKVAPFAADLRR